MMKKGLHFHIVTIRVRWARTLPSRRLRERGRTDGQLVEKQRLSHDPILDAKFSALRKS